MENLRKAFIMLSAAIVMDAMATDVVHAGVPAPNKKGKDKGKVSKNKKKKAQKRVKKVKRARRRPSWGDPDLGMPAGTAYDVIARQDLP